MSNSKPQERNTKELTDIISEKCEIISEKHFYPEILLDRISVKSFYQYPTLSQFFVNPNFQKKVTKRFFLPYSTNNIETVTTPDSYCQPNSVHFCIGINI